MPRTERRPEIKYTGDPDYFENMRSRWESLTGTELDIIDMRVTLALSKKEIAIDKGRSTQTIQVQTDTIHRKLGIKTLNELIILWNHFEKNRDNQSLPDGTEDHLP